MTGPRKVLITSKKVLKTPKSQSKYVISLEFHVYF
jgi:hypothetical protein